MNQAQTIQIKANPKLKSSHLNLFAILVFAWLASGCGASTTQTSQPITAMPLNPFSSTTNLVTSPQDTICNGFSTANIRLDAKLRTIPGSDDLMRVRITGMTNQFDSNNNITLKMFRWNTNNDGTPNLDSEPLSFDVQTGIQNGIPGFILKSSLTQISMSDVTNLAATNSINASTAETFFNQVDIIVHGVSFDQKAIKFVLYNQGAVVVSNDALLPEFSVNPNTYAATHAPVLAQLHPFHAELGLTDADYINQAQAFCF